MATEFLYHEPGTQVDSPAFSLTMTKSDGRPKLRIDVPDGVDLTVTPPQYLGWSISTYTQSHPQYERWGAIAKRTVNEGAKVQCVNAEGRTADEAIKNLKALLERKR